jgi:hypothetical protein
MPLTKEALVELRARAEGWSEGVSSEEILTLLADLEAKDKALRIFIGYIVRYCDHERTCHRFEEGFLNTQPEDCDCAMGMALEEAARVIGRPEDPQAPADSAEPPDIDPRCE